MNYQPNNSHIQESSKEESVKSSGNILEVEFHQENIVIDLMGKYPDKVNFIVSLGSLTTTNIKQAQTFKDSIAIGFYNQISIYGVEDSKSLT